MNRIAAGIAAIGLGVASATTAAQTYNATATVEFNWATDGKAIGWTNSADNSLAAMTNATFFSALTGNNSTAWYNADFATEAFFLALDPGPPGSTTSTRQCDTDRASWRQYACSRGSGTSQPFTVFPVADVGPGAKATGTLTVTDTTMVGTLTVSNTNDEGQGLQQDEDSNLLPEATGYNIRSADGSPFKNVWYGISNQMQLTVNLTGNFSATSWEINGGTVSFFDPAFSCGFADGSGTLCTPSTVGGGFRPNGQFLSWGLDQGTGAATGVTTIPVFDAAGTNPVATLSGVLASLSVAPNGAITTSQGETRTATGSSGGGCVTSLRYGTGGLITGTGITCGTLQVRKLDITGTTVAADLTPELFGFLPVTEALLNTLVESADANITGINAPAPISITGGEYRINGEAWTSAAGTVSDGDVVRVRLTSSPLVCVGSMATLVVGDSGPVIFNVFTQGCDTSPNPINFGSVLDAPLSSIQTSNTVPITGINVATPISITGGEYRINAGAFTGAAGTVVSNDEVTVRQTSSPNPDTTTNAFLTVGNQGATFSVTTGDTTPIQFTFTDVSNAALGVPITSNSVTIFGFSLPLPISIVGGEYSINTGIFTSTPGTVTNGQQVVVRQTSSSGPGITTNTVLTVGGVADTFAVTTSTAVNPDPFAFVDQTGVALGVPITSSEITVAGINVPVPIRVTNGEYSVNGGAFTAVDGNVVAGNTVRVRVTSSAAPSTAVSAVLGIGFGGGGVVADTFTVTTAAADTTPDAFSLTDQTGVALNTVTTSNQITVAGINTAAAISVAGGEYAKNGGAFTSAAGTVVAGDTVRVRVTSSSTVSTAVDATLTIGGISDTFTVTTTASSGGGGGGSSSMDLFAIGLLGGVAFLRRRRLMAR